MNEQVFRPLCLLMHDTTTMSILRTLFFPHAEPIIRIGRHRPVTPDDMLPFDPRLDPWDAEQQLQRIQLSTPWRMLWSSFWAAGAPS
ncbi:MAG: hypothetical protein N2663_07300, partial [Chlorobi bacterium]|nr:hypothetical protein [Chlorobiota bacterium]